MFRFIPYILKTLLRHRTRTLLTLSGAAVAFFVFVVVGAVHQGLQDLTDVGSDRTLIVFQANRFCPFTSILPEDYARSISSLRGVADVTPIRVYTNNCRASLDVVVFHGIEPAQLPHARKFDVDPAAWGRFEQRGDGALVGRALAQRRGLHVGDPFTVGGVTVNVAGIFTSDKPAEEDFVYTSLRFLQRLRGKNETGKVTQFEVKLADGADPIVTAQAIDDALRDGPVATNTRPKGAFQENALGDLVELIKSARWIGYGCVGLLVFALVATTTVMAVGDRTAEHAVLRTLGFTGQGIFGLIVAESSLVSLLGGTLGVLIADGFLALSGWSLGAEAVSLSVDPSLAISLLAVACAAAVGLAAGIVPGVRAARGEIVAALRHV